MGRIKFFLRERNCLITALTSALLFSADAKAQGTIIFYNRNLTDPVTALPYHAPVTLPDGSGVEGEAFTAGLFVVESSGLRLIETSFFRTGPGAGFFPGPLLATVPGVQTGFPATFRARVWETRAGSYENAGATGLLHGEFATGQPGNNLFVPELGPPPNSPGPLVPPDLSGIRPLTLVPEPSAGAIISLAGVLWLFMGRRNCR